MTSKAEILRESATQNNLSGPDTGSSRFRTEFACLFLHNTDKIRLLNFPENDGLQIRGIIQRLWTRGIQEIKPYGQTVQIKLHGNPWRTSATGQSLIEGRRMMCTLLGELLGMGWVLSQTTGVCRTALDKDSLIFRRQLPPPSPSVFLCISFGGNDNLHLIDTPPQLRHDITQTLGLLVKKQEQLGEKYSSAHEITFHGWPWSPTGEAAITPRLIVLKLLEVLEQHGFTLYASVNMDDQTVCAPDAWFCCREANWEPASLSTIHKTRFTGFEYRRFFNLRHREIRQVDAILNLGCGGL